METLAIVSIAGLAGFALAGVYALWGGVDRVQRECARRIDGVEDRMRSLDARVNGLEGEITRQGIELEDQGIRLETRAYWDE